MRSIIKGELGFVREGRSLLAAAVVLAGCSAATDDAGTPQELAQGDQTEATGTPTEDGLSDAFDTFINEFAPNDFDANYRIGYGYHPGLSTDKVSAPGSTALASGSATLNLNTGDVTATLNNVPDGKDFELWLVKNQPGGTMAPETTDSMLKVGKFSSGGNFRTLTVNIGDGVIFDMDLIVVTKAGKKPTESRIALGDRTVLEKRLFRFRQGKTLDAVKGTLANNIETTDPLVARGAQLFFNETFGGNGRTCGTCHRADDSLTIDPDFIAKLPKSDPLFVAETNPALAGLEDMKLLRGKGLILENLDGFDDPTHKFVMRGVPHTLSLGLTNGIASAFFGPPDQRLGWSGDGGPGRSSLHEFTFGAIVQHFTKSMARRPGVDFRIPTQEELDALEAFQLFTGRQKGVDFQSTFPTDEHASKGQNLFNFVGCTGCHNDTFGFTDSFNNNFDTGVSNLIPELPDDDGFNSPFNNGLGDRTFNVPPLVEAADTPPFFHNNAVSTIEDAAAFYFSDTFRASPSSFFIFDFNPNTNEPLTPEDKTDIAAFLRVINSASNIDQVLKRVEYVKKVRSTGNTDLLKVALADTKDARRVLSDKALSPDVQATLREAVDKLKSAIGDRDSDRPSTMSKVITLLTTARAALFTSTPPDGGGGGGFGGKSGTGGSFTAGSGPIEGGAPDTGGTEAGGSGPIGGFSTGGATSSGTMPMGGTKF
jgi:cytochrome c peroxidase